MELVLGGVRTYEGSTYWNRLNDNDLFDLFEEGDSGRPIKWRCPECKGGRLTGHHSRCTMRTD